jgi:hypothetical protein
MTRMRLARQGRSVRWLPATDGEPASSTPPVVEAPASSPRLVAELPDPAGMTVVEVVAWMIENPDYAEAVKALEADGKARKSILNA